MKPLKPIFKTFPNTQKIRIVINGVQVYTTVRLSHVSWHVFSALQKIDNIRISKEPCLGLVDTFAGKQIQVDLINPKPNRR